MALKRLKNGQYKIESKKQAVEAISLMLELEDAIRDLEKENGIDEMKMDSVELKKAATAFMTEKNAQALEIPKAGKVAKLVAGFDGAWIETKADLKNAGTPPGVKTLRAIVGKDLWLKITKRVLDPDKLAEAVATGAVDEDEIKNAYYEKPRAPYVRIYDE